MSGADQDILRAEEEYKEWIDKVQRRVLFPDVTIDPSAIMPTSLDPMGSAQPIVLSSSVINSDGRRADTRMW